MTGLPGRSPCLSGSVGSVEVVVGVVVSPSTEALTCTIFKVRPSGVAAPVTSMDTHRVIPHSDEVGKTIWVWMAYSMVADTLHEEAPVATDVRRPVTHVMVGWVVDDAIRP
jgi:hypothetical protein